MEQIASGKQLLKASVLPKKNLDTIINYYSVLCF